MTGAGSGPQVDEAYITKISAKLLTLGKNKDRIANNMHYLWVHVSQIIENQAYYANSILNNF